MTTIDTTATRIIVLGRQGAGKGTQCTRLATRLGLRHLSTGELFRAASAAGTALGRRVDRYLATGDLVPDELVLDVVAAHLGDHLARSQGYLLDGFPRTLDQGQALFEVLGADAADLAVEIDVPVAVVVPRLSARRVCASCALVTTARPDDVLGQSCTRCGGELIRRIDDHPEAIARRLALYDERAFPLLRWLDEQHMLVTVDGVGHPDEVHERVVAAVTDWRPALASI